jgi:hypothetical protein
VQRTDRLAKAKWLAESALETDAVAAEIRRQRDRQTARLGDDRAAAVIGERDLHEFSAKGSIKAPGDADFEAPTKVVHRANTALVGQGNPLTQPKPTSAVLAKEQRPWGSNAGRTPPRRNAAASWSRSPPGRLQPEAGSKEPTSVWF